MLMVTCDTIEGKKCEAIGVIQSSVVSHTKMINAIKNAKDMKQVRKRALDELVAEAARLGADAIVAIRYDCGIFDTVAIEVSAYGTAVRFI